MWMVAQINMARHKVHWVGQPVAARRRRRRACGRGRAGADRGRLRAAAGRARYRRGHGARCARAARARLHQGRGAAAARAEQRLLAHRDRARRRARARSPRRRRPRASSVAGRHRAPGLSRAAGGGGAGRRQRLRHGVGLHPGPVHRRADDRRACSACRSRSSRSCRSRSAAASAARSPSTARPWPCGWRRNAGRPVKLVLTREEVLQGGSGPAAAALIDIAVGADKDGRLVAIEGTYRLDAGGLPGLSPSLRHAGLGRALPMPEPQPAGLRRRHQQAAHRGLSRARRHPGGLRHGAGDGRAVPAARHGPAGVPQAQRLGDRQHRCRSARRFPSIGLTTILERVRRARLLARSAAQGPLPARARACARLLARHVDDLGRRTSRSPATAARW